MVELNKIQYIVLVAIVLVIAGTLYLGNSLDRGRTNDEIAEIKTEVKSRMLAGELGSYTGKIVSMKEKSLVLDNEIEVFIMEDTLVRKIEFQESPEELTPAKEIFIDFEDLKVGNEVFVDVDKENNALMIDLIKEDVFLEVVEEEAIEEAIGEVQVPVASTDMFAGNIMEIKPGILVIKVSTSDKNVNVNILDDTIIRKVVFPEDNDGSSRGEEVVIELDDLEVGERVALVVDENNNAIFIDK